MRCKDTDMDDLTLNHIHVKLNKVIIRRLLARYFVQLGFDKNPTARVYPPLLGSIDGDVPQLSGMVEVVPSVKKADPISGRISIVWNLFVLGNNRLYLGTTDHDEMSESGIIGGTSGPAKYEKTPVDIINFIEETLSKSDSGQVNIHAARPWGSINKARNGMQIDMSGFMKRA